MQLTSENWRGSSWEWSFRQAEWKRGRAPIPSAYIAHMGGNLHRQGDGDSVNKNV